MQHQGGEWLKRESGAKGISGQGSTRAGCWVTLTLTLTLTLERKRLKTAINGRRASLGVAHLYTEGEGLA